VTCASTKVEPNDDENREAAQSVKRRKVLKVACRGQELAEVYGICSLLAPYFVARLLRLS
jgi:hypothetical protein